MPLNYSNPEHKKKLDANYKRYCQRHPEIIKAYRRKYSKSEKRREYLIKHYDQYLEYRRKSTKKRYKEIRFAIITLLGGKCSNPKCLVISGCTEPKCLQVDHIKNDGVEDRKRFNNPRTALAYYLSHPEEAKQKLQLLCANCNWIKEFDHRYPDFHS